MQRNPRPEAVITVSDDGSADTECAREQPVVCSSAMHGTERYEDIDITFRRGMYEDVC